MIEKEYDTFRSVGVTVKYNIDYDRHLFYNIVCANYLYDLLIEGYDTLLTTEQLNLLLELIRELLGHEIYYGKLDFHTKTCYFGVVDDAFEVTEENIKALSSFEQRNRIFEGTVTTLYQKVLYAYPTSFGDLKSIVCPDSRQFLLLKSFTKYNITIDGVSYNVYLLTRSSSVDDYQMIFA